MKKILYILLTLLLTSTTATADVVLRQPITLQLGDVTREGLFTGSVNEEGKPDGFGVVEASNSAGLKWHYVGDWVNGTMQGQGQTSWESGQTTVGQYENNNFITGLRIRDPQTYIWIDYSDTIKVKDGIIASKAKVYDNGALLFDGYINVEEGTYYKGTRYNRDGTEDCTGYFNGYRPEE